MNWPLLGAYALGLLVGLLVVLLPASAAPATHLSIPSIGVDSWVAPVYGSATVDSGVGQYTRTYGLYTEPGQPGTIVLGRHDVSLWEGAVFQRLTELQVGDAILLSDGLATYLYEVTNTEVVVNSLASWEALFAPQYRIVAPPDTAGYAVPWPVVEREMVATVRLATCVNQGSHYLVVTGVSP